MLIRPARFHPEVGLRPIEKDPDTWKHVTASTIHSRTCSVFDHQKEIENTTSQRRLQLKKTANRKPPLVNRGSKTE